MTDEIWKPVPGYEDFYEVSNCGRLRRIATPSGKPRNKIIAPHKKRDGYSDYWLWLYGQKKRLKAHRLVWIAHRGDIPSDLQINHKNGVKSDNRLTNLELVTRSENAKHSFRELGRPSPNHPSYGTANGSAVLDDEAVRHIRSLYGSKSAYQYELAAMFGVSQRTINLVVRRLTWRHVA